ncbi:MAG: J domain-containing protein [Bacteroidia bacterium]|jgi:hypothetical protein|nr:J domain-containing protein [Bacteroidia bacterium]
MRADDLKLLGLPANCSEEAIRKAWRKQAFLLHPDTSKDPAAHEKFHTLAAAYERLLANNYPPELHRPVATQHKSATYHNIYRKKQEALTPRQKFWRKTGSVLYRIFTPVLFLLLFLLTPVWLMLIPVIPWMQERKREKGK